MSVTLDKQMQSCGGSLRALCVRERERERPGGAVIPPVNNWIHSWEMTVAGCHIQKCICFSFHICRVMPVPYHHLHSHRQAFISSLYSKAPAERYRLTSIRMGLSIYLKTCFQTLPWRCVSIIGGGCCSLCADWVCICTGEVMYKQTAG